MKAPLNYEIALVDKLDALKPCVNFGYSPEISVAIGRVDEADGKPRNFSLDYETPKTSNGGCFARIFASECGQGTSGNLFSWYGPALSFPDMRQYQHGLRAMERIAKRMDAMHKQRGASVDAADTMGRWLEACSVSRVYRRPDAYRNECLLSRGDWIIMTLGEFVNLVRRNLYVNPVPADEHAANIVASNPAMLADALANTRALNGGKQKPDLTPINVTPSEYVSTHAKTNGGEA